MTETGHALIYCTLALLALTWLGNVAARALFALTAPSATDTEPDDSTLRAGRVIGTLERTLIAAGLLTQRWEVLAAVIALKSVARFQELNKKEFAEYFLVGSLFSIFWALGVTALWIGYDAVFGLCLRGALLPAQP